MKKTTTEAAEQTSARPQERRESPAFLLAQVGAHAALLFSERLSKLDLAPPHAGILRILSASPGITQQALSTMLGVVPSRLVALVDELESRQLIERRGNPDDRRRYALFLTENGRSTLGAIGRTAREHSQSLLTALSEEEQRQLGQFLQRIAAQQGLTPGVHPGFRHIGRSGGGASGAHEGPVEPRGGA